MYRNTSAMESKQMDFQKTERNTYVTTDGHQHLVFSRSVATLQRGNQQLVLPKVRNSPGSSSKELVEEILEEKYIVHSNVHQRTFFDCRKDAQCYIIKYCEQMPYDTSMWFLTEFEGELFLSYYNSRGFLRVYADQEGLVFAYALGVDKGNTWKAELSAKKNGTLCR